MQVEGILGKLDSLSSDQKKLASDTLARLSHREAPYAGDWWWSTRPDTRGPYYKLEKWAKSDAIEKALVDLHSASDPALQNHIAVAATVNRTGFKGLTIVESKKKDAGPNVDLSKIAGQKGAVGKMSIEDVMLAIDETKGNAKDGAKLFNQQGCIACHTLKADDAPKGPFMGQIGSIMTRDQIAESILRPNASISQGFASWAITAKENKVYMGFITAEDTDTVTVRDVAGQVHNVAVGDILERKELEISMMPPGLANALSIEEFASMLTFLQEQK